ncbi:MAG: VWA domain-containing protein [Pseudomonas profundi]|uniref:VWA domain-containing protein n=1 Tax=Pseudomonas profundi TaxID=1981513 RepID=UPI0030033818
MEQAIEKQYPVSKSNQQFATLIAEEMRLWRTNLKSMIFREFPFEVAENRLTEWRGKMPFPQLPEDLQACLDEYLQFCKDVGRPSNKRYWDNEVVKLRKPKRPGKHGKATSDITSQLLLDEWQKGLDQARGEWELRLIDEQRRALLEKLTQLMKLLAELDEQLALLGLETGVLLDLSSGRLSEQDISQLKRWVAYMANDPGVRELCDLLGKMRQMEASTRLERATVSFSFEAFVPDTNSREEIVGVELGRHIEYALPSELALLSDSDTSTLFDLKYVEGRLLCFEMNGESPVELVGEREVEQEVDDEGQQGPMVICIDTSGSMSGMPETIAKAVALFMASKAREKKRACYLINFSTGIETLDLGESFGMKSLLSFLKKSFHGGTDVAPAVRHGLKIMQTESYEKADLLIVSDFIMSSLPGDMVESITKQREAGNQFYSLVIGSHFLSPSLHSLFDREWVFNPATSSITELLSFQHDVGVRSPTSHVAF